MYGPNLRQFPVTYGIIQSSREQTSPGTIGGTEGTLPRVRTIVESVPLSALLPVRMPVELSPFAMRSMGFDYPVLTQIFQVSIDAISTFTVSLSKLAASARSLAVPSTFTASLTKSAAFLRALAVTSTLSPSVVKAWARALDATTTMNAALARARGYVRTLAVQYGRASTATYTDASGVVQTAGVDVARNAHYVNGVSTPLYEPIAGTNICLQSENFGTTWTSNGTPTRTPAAHTASGITLDLIGDDSVGVAEGYQQTPTFTGNGAKAISFYVRAGTAASSAFRLFDSTAAQVRALGSWSWSGGLPVVATTFGTYLGYEQLTDGVFRLLFSSASSVLAANAHIFRVFAAADTSLGAAPVGTVYWGGTQIEDVAVPTSYMKTTTATATRAADVGYYTPTVSRAIGHFVSVTSTFTAVITKQAARLRALAVSSAFASSLQKGVGKFLSVASSFVGALVQQAAYQRALSLSSTFTPNLNAKAAHLLALAVAATLTPVVTVGRGFFRTLAVANAWAVSVTRLITHTYLQSLAATSAFGASLARAAARQRVLSVASSYVPSLVRVASHPRTLAVVLPMVVVLQRGIAMRLAVASVFVTAVNRGLNRMLAADSPFIPAVVKTGGALFFGFLVRILSAFQPRGLDSVASEAESHPNTAFEVRRSG